MGKTVVWIASGLATLNLLIAMCIPWYYLTQDVTNREKVTYYISFVLTYCSQSTSSPPDAGVSCYNGAVYNWRKDECFAENNDCKLMKFSYDIGGAGCGIALVLTLAASLLLYKSSASASGPKFARLALLLQILAVLSNTIAFIGFAATSVASWKEKLTDAGCQSDWISPCNEFSKKASVRFVNIGNQPGVIDFGPSGWIASVVATPVLVLCIILTFRYSKEASSAYTPQHASQNAAVLDSGSTYA